MQLLRLEQLYHDELNMELQGVTFSASVSKGNSQIPVGDVDVEESTKKILDQVAEDELNLSKVSMSRKQRGLMEAIQVCSSFFGFLFGLRILFKFSCPCLDIIVYLTGLICHDIRTPWLIIFI